MNNLDPKSKPRIIFVGVHNKPGMTPLDSRTKSGELIDRLIAGLQMELGLFEADFIKTNLFDSLQIPHTISKGHAIEEWKNRVGHKKDDLVIALGLTVQGFFTGSMITFMAIGHPSHVWSKLKQEEYIINACIKVSEVLKPETV